MTRNTEYHFATPVCVAVRGPSDGRVASGSFGSPAPPFRQHTFLHERRAAPESGEPKIGEALFFGEGGRDLITSPLESVARPPKELVADYPS